MALGPGSIAFVGLNSDGNDNLAFVVLEPITAGTVIYFQDNEWNGLGIGAGGAFNTGESGWSWTATSSVAAGTIIAIDNVGGGTIATNSGSVAFFDTSNRGLANSNEVIYAFVGTSGTAPTAFLTAVANNTFAATGSIAGTGLTAGLNALEARLLVSHPDLDWSDGIRAFKAEADAVIARNRAERRKPG
jgi:hypothetical protein